MPVHTSPEMLRWVWPLQTGPGGEVETMEQDATAPCHHTQCEISPPPPLARMDVGCTGCIAWAHWPDLAKGDGRSLVRTQDLTHGYVHIVTAQTFVVRGRGLKSMCFSDLKNSTVPVGNVFIWKKKCVYLGNKHKLNKIKNQMFPKTQKEPPLSLWYICIPFYFLMTIYIIFFFFYKIAFILYLLLNLYVLNIYSGIYPCP